MHLLNLSTISLLCTFSPSHQKVAKISDYYFFYYSQKNETQKEEAGRVYTQTFLWRKRNKAFSFFNSCIFLLSCFCSSKKWWKRVKENEKKTKRSPTKKRGRKRQKRGKSNFQKLWSYFSNRLRGTDANGKFWCDLSTYNRGENTVRKKRTVFWRGQKNRQITCPTKSSIIKNPSTIIITPKNPGRNKIK